MTIDEIRKNAPDGATHYRKFSCTIRFIKFDNDDFSFGTTINGLGRNCKREQVHA